MVSISLRITKRSVTHNKVMNIQDFSDYMLKSSKCGPNASKMIWLAICFKIMTRYTCGFFPRILAIIPAARYTCFFLPRILAFFPALWGFYSQVHEHFLTNAHIYAHKKSPYISVTNKQIMFVILFWVF